MNIFISWIKFHGRSAELAEKLGAEPVFLESRWPRMPTVIRYVDLSIQTALVLRKQRWGAVIVMLPPFPLLIVAKIFRPKRARLIADMHTGVFSDPKWTWALRLTLRMLVNESAIVTNPTLMAVCGASGVRAFAVHDIVSDKKDTTVAAAQSTVLCPLGYASDEPISELIEAASLLPNVTFLFTGQAPEHLKESAPKNVHFTGYLSNSDYEDTMQRSSAVIALTTRDHTMQRAGYEALMCGIPVVTSDFALLRDYFGSAALYSDCSASDIRQKIALALSEGDELRSESATLLSEKIIEQNQTVSEVWEMLNSAPRVKWAS